MEDSSFTLVGFLWGLGVSLAAILIVAFTKKTWSTWLGSKLRAVLPRGGIDISGDYDAEYWEEGEEEGVRDESVEKLSIADNPDGTERIEIIHRGRHISGRIIRDVKGAEDRISAFTGECADRHVTGTYKSMDPKNPERGSFCLKISNGGAALRGGYLWYNTGEGKETIDYGRYVWRRK